MKKAKSINEQEEGLSFSFLKRKISNAEIKAHWQKIQEQIKPGASGIKDKQGDGDNINQL